MPGIRAFGSALDGGASFCKRVNMRSNVVCSSVPCRSLVSSLNRFYLIPCVIDEHYGVCVHPNAKAFGYGGTCVT